MGRGRTDLRLAWVTGIAEGWAGGYRKDLDRDAALAEIRAITTDVEVLAEAAARYAEADITTMPHAYRALALMIELGATLDVIARHLEARAVWKARGDVLLAMGDANRGR